MFQQCECGAREERETNVVVFVAIDLRTREEVRSFEEVSWSTRGVAKPEANLMNLAAPLDAHVLNGAAVQQRSIDLLVKRKDKLSIDIETRERFRQRARYISQPTGFGERHSFRSQDGYTHFWTRI